MTGAILPMRNPEDPILIPHTLVISKQYDRSGSCRPNKPISSPSNVSILLRFSYCFKTLYQNNAESRSRQPTLPNRIPTNKQG